MQSGIRVAVGMCEHHPIGCDARRLEQIEHLVGRRAELQVHHHRRPGRTMSLGDREQRRVLEGGDAPVADAGLEHACPNRGAIGGGGARNIRSLEHERIVDRHPTCDIGDEQCREAVIAPRLQRVVGAVVGLAMAACGRDHVHPGARADAGDRLGVAAEPEGCGVDHGLEAAGPQQSGLLPREIFVVEFVTREQG